MFSLFNAYSDEDFPDDDELNGVADEPALWMRGYMLERLESEAPAFLEDDRARGRQCTDAALQLADALMRRHNEVIDGGCDHARLVDAVVDFVRQHEGEAASRRAVRFAAHVEQRQHSGGILQLRPAEHLSEDILNVWRQVVNQTLTANYSTIVHFGRAISSLPVDLYDRWAQSRTLDVIGLLGGEARALDLSYSLTRDELGNVEEDHTERARHALTPLVDSARRLAGEYSPDAVRIDLTVTVCLMREQRARVTGSHKATSVTCSLAYRCYAVAPQRLPELPRDSDDEAHRDVADE